MMIGIYFPDGECVAAPLDRAAQLTGVSEYLIKQAMEGKHKFPGVVICRLPESSSVRVPAKCPKLGKRVAG